MNYYKKYIDDSEVYYYASMLPPQNMEGLEVIEEDEFNAYLEMMYLIIKMEEAMLDGNTEVQDS